MKRLLLMGMILSLLLPGAALASDRGFLRGTEPAATAEPAGTVEGKGFLRGTWEAAPEGAQHLLWDIPFGTPADEVKALVREKTGLVLEGDVYDWGGTLTTAAMPPVEMLGQTVSLSFDFGGEGGLESITVNFQAEAYAPMVTAGFAQAEDVEQVIYDLVEEHYAGIHDGLVQRYGQPGGGVLAVGEENGEESPFFNYPGGAEGLDLRQFAQAAADYENAGIITRYGNVYELMVVIQQPELATARDDLMRAELYVMLMLLEDGADFVGMMDDVPEINGFETTLGEYPGKVVHLDL